MDNCPMCAFTNPCSAAACAMCSYPLHSLPSPFVAHVTLSTPSADAPRLDVLSDARGGGTRGRAAPVAVGTVDALSTAAEKPEAPAFGGSRISHRVYVRGLAPTTSLDALGAHVNAAFSRAFRPGAFVVAAHPLPGGKAAILVFTSAVLATAALQLDDALLCDGARLALRRPQGWWPSPDDELVAPLELHVVREEEGAELPPPHVVEARLARQREAVSARPKGAHAAKPPPAAASVRAPRPMRAPAAAPAPPPAAPPPPPVVLDHAQAALVAALRGSLSRKAFACLEALCRRTVPSFANGQATFSNGLHGIPTSIDVFTADVLELFSVLHAHGVRIVATEKVKGLQITIMKPGGGSSAGASHQIPHSPSRVGVQMQSVAFLREALREVGFPCNAFA